MRNEKKKLTDSKNSLRTNFIRTTKLNWLKDKKK